MTFRMWRRYPPFFPFGAQVARLYILTALPGAGYKSKFELTTTSSRPRSSPFFVIRTSKSKSELPTTSSRARSSSFFVMRTSTTVAGIITLGIVSNGIITTTYNSTTPDHHEYKRE